MSTPPRFAVITTAYFPDSHADVITSRWTTKRTCDADFGWDGPKSSIASLYIQQFPNNDIGRAFAAQHAIPLYDSVEAALCCGGGKLAVDGVILIGEHGEYPLSELGQKMYPRAELFDRIVAVFKDSGRCVPVFNDKGYAWNPADAVRMVRTAREMGFLLASGSSITLCSLRGELSPWQPDRPLSEVVAVYYGPREAYSYHSFEAVQALIEKRTGGETGVRSMTAYPREMFDAALARSEWSRQLMNDAMTVCNGLAEGDWRQNVEQFAIHKTAPDAVVMQYHDGLRVTHVNLDGAVRGWSVAGREADGRMWSRGYRAAGSPTHHAHFATLSARIERELITGQSAVPPMRSLMTTLCTSSLMKAFNTPGQVVPTPELALVYQPT